MFIVNDSLGAKGVEKVVLEGISMNLQREVLLNLFLGL